MIDYCKQILGKSIRDITIEHLNLYFSEVKEETENLEFKSGLGDFEGVFNNNVLKTVSAFLNSSGGVLIWGAPEDKAPEKGKPKECIGELAPVKERKEKDQLINRISSAISYMPSGIRIERIDSENGYVYIIEVQESTSKPHQLNGQYFIRLDGQSKPAPHYLVDSMFKAVKLPELEGRIIFSERGRYHKDSIYIKFAVLIENRSLFINETNVKYRLLGVPGYFLATGKGVYTSEQQEVLHYGQNWLQEHTLIVKLPYAEKLERIAITLTFGGAKGPSLTSYYLIDPGKFNQHKPFDFSDYVIEYTENQNFKERQELLGVTQADALDTLIDNLRPSRSKNKIAKAGR